ncbi:MAG: response regulator, partial [Verrucomicrobiota bacterium]
DILDFTRYQSEGFTLDHHDFCLQSTMESAMSVIVPRCRNKGLELMLYCNPNVPKLLHGDSTRLRQILVNLLGNASKFTEEGEILLGAFQSGQRTDKDGVQRILLTFMIYDTGIGIPKGKVEDLFDSFTQADNSTTRKFGGTGLGLAISKQLVEFMGGSIRVDTDQDQGSTFYFTAEFELAHAPSAFGGQLKKQKMMISQLRGKRALIIEDNLKSRHILEQHCQTWQMSTLCINDIGMLNRVLADSKPFDVILCDFSTMESSDYLVNQMIKESGQHRDTPIILLSTCAKIHDDSSQPANFDQQIQKPFRYSSLVEAIAEATGVKAARTAPPVGVSHHHFRTDPDDATPLKSMHILLVDDNQINRTLGTKILNKMGYTNTKLATDGVEATKLVMEDDFDLVLMDLDMPMMDGLTATREIRSRGVNLPIVAATAAAMPGDRERCMSAGMNGYISKPLARDELKRIVESFDQSKH